MTGDRMTEILSREEIDALVFETFGIRRMIHDGPIKPDVWVRYFAVAQTKRKGVERVSLILTPRRDAGPDGNAPASAGEIAATLRERLGSEPGRGHLIAATSRYLVADLNFLELIRHVLPMTNWWRELRYARGDLDRRFAELRQAGKKGSAIIRDVRKVDLFRLIGLAGLLQLLFEARGKPDRGGARRKRIRRLAALLVTRPDELDFDDELEDLPDDRRRRRAIFADIDGDISFDDATIDDLVPIWEAFVAALGDHAEPPDGQPVPIVWSVQRNRRVFRPSAGLAAGGTVRRAGLSRDVVKADAAIRLFDLTAADLTFAVVDTGVWAGHLALREWQPGPRDRAAEPPPSRVKKTLDFTRLRRLMDDPGSIQPGQYDDKIRTRIAPAIAALRAGSADVDWSVLEPLMWVNDEAMTPADSHGTHVAGILAGHIPPLRDPPEDDLEDWEVPFQGVCPDLKLYDLRVFGAESDGDEFSVLAALDYVAWINRDPGRPVIHGVNLSLSLRSLVNVSACGRTPICEAANRLVAMGTVVVAAAGNAGFDPLANGESIGFGYRSISITDPANAEDVISVGATHWSEPHTYGVSYFSSRGPTGDGRIKPDLVAPGEKILSSVLGDRFDRKDGTSMAAPHVSGICALLMARHKELVGRPDRIKQILMRSATDLGRDRNFQGAGLVDALRALQSV